MTKPRGLYLWEHWSRNRESRGGPVFRRRLLAKGRFKNGITTAGLNALGETNFRGGTVYTSWFAGLIDQNYYTALSPADVMSSHAGWRELQGYQGSNRPAWSPSPGVSGVFRNSAGVAYTFTGASQTIQGAFLASDNTLGGTAGLLFSTGLLDTPLQFQAGELFRLYYVLTFAAGVGS
jgi:hypothetical protein